MESLEGQGAHGAAPVSREASAVAPPSNRRPYRSPYRLSVAAAKERGLIEAVLILAQRGEFRASAQQIADLAGVRRQSICRYFGSVDLFYRRVAREHWRIVADHLPFERPAFTSLADAMCWSERAVWAVLVGRPKALS